MQKYKSIIIIVTLVTTIIACITTSIIILTESYQKATSRVNVKFTAVDVSLNISATAYYGEDETNEFTSDGTAEGERVVHLTPESTTVTLSQQNIDTAIELNKANNAIVFEYVFESETEDEILIKLSSLPTFTNFTVAYEYTKDPVESPLTLKDLDPEVNVVQIATLPKYDVVYVYIVAQIYDVMYDASIEGDFNWDISREEVNIMTFFIAGQGRTFEEGMTWGEFVDSEYNIDGLYINDANNNVEFPVGLSPYSVAMIINQETNMAVTANEEVVGGTYYAIMYIE